MKQKAVACSDMELVFTKAALTAAFDKQCKSYLSTDSELPDAMLSASSSLKSIQIRNRSRWLQSRGLVDQKLSAALQQRYEMKQQALGRG
ncbi:MAG: hypothetical protein FRX49_13424 [Trebouxia sp. A1-2]|nr:MAG: hypothetical protein FRX49_13424 [Trebouxia sp. A1-2]